MCLSHCVLYLHQGFIENIRLINCQLKKVGVPQEQSETVFPIRQKIPSALCMN